MATDRMMELALDLPIHFLAARENADPVSRRRGRLDVVCVGGMGGSGIGGRLAAGLLGRDSRVPILTCPDYELPAAVGRDSCFVAVSHSGETEETLSAYRQAVGRGCRIVVITSGGELGRLAGGAGHPVVLVPGGIPPRAALGYLFGSLLAVLESLGACRNYESDAAEAAALGIARRHDWLRQARRLAGLLDERLAVVYSTSRLLDAVTERWRAQLNENAKVLCHTHALPEQNHNEIVGLGGPGFLPDRTVVVALAEPGTHPRTRRRLHHLLAIKRAAYKRAKILEAEGRSPLARLLSLVMLGDLVSVALAHRRRVDAMAIPAIVELKKRMAKDRA